MKFILFFISIFLFSKPATAKTHCYSIVGEGKNWDSDYAIESSYLIEFPPLKGTCKDFKTWDELYSYYKTEVKKNSYDTNDQFFISQSVHGTPGGRAWDAEKNLENNLENFISIYSKENKISPEFIDQLGGTSTLKIINILEAISKDHKVAYHNRSCHGGSLLTYLIQKWDKDEKITSHEQNLCVVTDSFQGSFTGIGQSVSNYISYVKNKGTEANIDFSGFTILDLFLKRNFENFPFFESISIFKGLISSAKMSVLPHQKLSQWEVNQFPMMIHHKPNDLTNDNWTGAYKNIPGDSTLGKKTPHPIFGYDCFTESIFTELNLKDEENIFKKIGPYNNAHHACKASLLLANEELSDKQKTRYQACDQFVF